MTEGDVTGKHEEGTNPETDEDGSYLDELPDGSGCTEIWEHLSERRQQECEERQRESAELPTREDG